MHQFSQWDGTIFAYPTALRWLLKLLNKGSLNIYTIDYGCIRMQTGQRQALIYSSIWCVKINCISNEGKIALPLFCQEEILRG